jgi:hypothetical protein
MHPVAIKVALTMFCIAVMLDQSQWRRVIMVTIVIGIYGFNLRKTQQTDQKDLDTKRKSIILDGLSVPYLEANSRIVNIFHKLRVLRKFNESDFSVALKQTNELLKQTQLKQVNDQELVLMKDQVINTMAQYAFRLPKLFEEKMRFSEKLKTLDTVLYLETIRSPNEVFPLPSSTNDPHRYMGHDTSTTPFRMT